MNEFAKITSLLKDEAAIQETLLEILTRERAAIVRLRQDELDKIQQEKERVLDSARSTGEKRADLISRITPEKKISVVLSQPMPEHIRKELKLAADELKVTSERVQELNSVNSQLLKQALGIITSSLAIFRSAPGTELPVYGKKGALSSENDDPAFAKRSGVSREA